VAGPGAAAFTYSPNGDQLTAGGDVFAYNTARQVKSATVGGVASTFTYDGRGARYSRTTGGLVTKSTVDPLFPMGAVIDETTFNANGTVNSSQEYAYTPGGGLLGYRGVVGVQPAVYGSFLTDGLGSVTEVTTATGTVGASYRYNQYGAARPATSIQAAYAGNTMRFTGQQLDPSGTYNLRARQYNPVTGRFTQTDPTPYGAGSSFESSYVYGRNNPGVYSDPSGLRAEKTCGSVHNGEVKDKVPSLLKPVTNFLFGGGETRCKYSVVVPMVVSETAVHLAIEMIPGKSCYDLAKEGLTLADGFGCALDVAVVGGAAYRIVKAGRAGSRLIEAEKFVEAAEATRASPCSFGGETLVLMADGTTKPISRVKVGDMVLAQDPETGEIGARKVTDAWVHDDDLVRLEIDGDVVRTTEDHPFWNDTDREWQRADQLDHGDQVLTSDGRRVKVGVLIGSAGRGSAYNFTVEGLHTYHVLFGTDAVLVHNQCRGLWEITEAGTAATRTGPFGKLYKSKSDGLWWSKDTAEHGQSAWKVYEETAEGLRWRADADVYGDFIVGKHKGPTGKFIPWSQIRK
jgi:RHS repeat-associated protein